MPKLRTMIPKLRAMDVSTTNAHRSGPDPSGMGAEAKQ